MSQLKIKDGNNWIDIPAGGIGVPSGGTIGQVLQKSSNTDYATEWGDAPQSKLLVEEIEWTGTSVAAGGLTVQSHSCLKTGYNPIGVVGEYPSGGAFTIRGCYLGKNSNATGQNDPSLVYIEIRNNGTAAATPTCRVHVLYEKV